MSQSCAVEDLDGNRLVIRAQSGDSSAFGRLYLRYYDLVYGYGRMMLKDAHEAEDVAQDVFLRVLRVLPDYEPQPERPFRVLLLRIARNRSIDYLRKRGRWDVQPPDGVEGRSESVAVAEDPSVALDGLREGKLDVVLRRLPASQRQVVMLRYMFDLSTQQVAEVISAPPQVVRNLQYRGLQSLRAALT